MLGAVVCVCLLLLQVIVVHATPSAVGPTSSGSIDAAPTAKIPFFPPLSLEDVTNFDPAKVIANAERAGRSNESSSSSSSLSFSSSSSTSNSGCSSGESTAETGSSAFTSRPNLESKLSLETQAAGQSTSESSDASESDSLSIGPIIASSSSSAVNIFGQEDVSTELLDNFRFISRVTSQVESQINSDELKQQSLGVNAVNGSTQQIMQEEVSESTAASAAGMPIELDMVVPKTVIDGQVAPIATPPSLTPTMTPSSIPSIQTVISTPSVTPVGHTATLNSIASTPITSSLVILAASRSCPDGETEISVAGSDRTFCLVHQAEGICSGDNQAGACPGAQEDLAFGSYCTLVQEGVYGCRKAG